MGAFKLGERPALNGLRGVAVLLVIALHFSGGSRSPLLHGKMRGGFIGVEMFFVLSGFLITSIVLSEVEKRGSLNLKSFYRRRGFRLLPALYVMIGGCIAFSVVHPVTTFGSLRSQFVMAVVSVTYLMNLTVGLVHNPLPLWSRPLWSLCVEVHFYAIWPPMLVWVAKRRSDLLPWLAVGVIVTSVTLRIVTFELWGSPYHTIFTPNRLDGLAMGALVAILLHQGWTPPRRIDALALVGAVVLGVIAIEGRTGAAWMVMVGYTAVGLSTAAIMLSALSTESPIGRLLNTRPLRLVGDWSYSLYLWHLPVFAVVGTEITGPKKILVVAIVLTFVVGGISANFVEAPLRRLGRRPIPAAVAETTA